MVVIDKLAKAKKKTPKEMLEELYSLHLSSRAVAKELGVSHGTLRTYMRDNRLHVEFVAQLVKEELPEKVGA